MNVFLRGGLVDPKASSREAMRSALLHLGTVWIENECDDYAGAVSALGEEDPEVVFVGLDADPVAGIETIRHLSRRFGSCRIVAFSHSSEGSLILKAIRGGAQEFLTLPVDPGELAAALRNVGTSREAAPCLTLAVAGATGGVGATNVAVNLAAVLAEDPRQSVVLVDLDLALGDVDVLLDVLPGQTLAEVLENVDRLDIGLLRRSLSRVDSGLYVLPRPERVNDGVTLRAECLHRLMVQLKASFSRIVLDLSKSYSRLDGVALEHCDQAVLVTQLTLPSLRNVVRLQDAFQDIEGLDSRLQIVVNRCSFDSPVRLKKAEEIMEREIFWKLPNDYARIVDACNQGLPITVHHPKAEWSEALRAMAVRLTEPPQEGVQLPAHRSPGNCQRRGRDGKMAEKGKPTVGTADFQPVMADPVVGPKLGVDEELYRQVELLGREPH